ncbi:MAG: serine/threonine-protein kinase [Chloroflexi bacterium]|nr:serine/threonine-protein kinase [Chloroflexota bacterium]
MPSLLGQTLLNQYHIEEFITHVPLGELYRATDIRSNKSLALTLLPKAISENAEILKSLETESAKLRAISHPNIAAYLGLFQTPTLAFLLEDWIDGPSLTEILNKREPLTINEALIYVKAICSALETLHKHNYLHLNLAPELIHVDKLGTIFLGGIGAARLLGTHAIQQHKTPPLYLSPEQLSDQPLTPASDIYAFTVLIYQLITGAWINGKSAPKTNETIRKAHLEHTPPAPISINKKIPDHFSRMILWALRKKPDDRLKTTTELLSSLALAAQISVDEIPLRITPTTAPVTSAILGGWSFLPPPKQNLIAQDLLPLEDRLAAISTPKPKTPRTRLGIVPIFVFIMVAGFASLFWLVHPAPTPIATSIKLTPFAADYTPPPTTLPTPRPTEEHGGRIAFTCTRRDYNQLCMVNRDGTGLSQLTDMEASNYYPVFSPDGSSLLFSSNRNGAFDLYLLSFDKKELFQLTDHVGNVISPDYSPDGRKIVFANRVGDETTSIWIVNSDGLNPHFLYKGTNTIVGVAWSPDGERIAYAMSVGIPQEYEIFIMNSDGKNHVRISQGLMGIGGSIDWSPDSKYLLIHAGPYEDKDIFRVDATTGDFTQLTYGGNNAGAVYSPDGRYILFNSLRNDDQADLYIMRADGENQQQLTNDPEPDWGAQWSP